MHRIDIVKINEYLQIDDFNLNLILKCLDEIHQLPILQEQLLIAKHQIFMENQFDLSDELKAIVENNLQGANFFPLIVLLEKFDDVLKFYSKHNLPKEILHHTFSDVNLWIRNYKERYQKDGFEEIRWLKNHFKNEIFRLGRLQFIYKKNYLKARVYKHKMTKELLIVPHDQVEFDDEGFVKFTFPIAVPGLDTNIAYFSSEVTESETVINSNCLLNNGTMMQGNVIITKADYECILDENDYVLDVHVPGYEPLDTLKCKQSFEQAVQFYNTYFSEYSYKAFVCDSWLHTPHFKEILDADSNIRKFSSLFTLVSGVALNYAFLFFVFGTSDPDLDKLVRKSSLQEAVYNHLQSNKNLCVTSGLIMIE
ncbi:hypothetical protein A8709_10230 [Paenibacillus pectinilyticus]|uniref:Uncharacterized protein n=1 Tax=Paenibacillus pectinilyticus TaxID=512399 RepID=A0A1C1A606_9BACL|nr:acyltransferase domain-containing protein [Paenibacillus pectinilyticus]OCT15988.1 hypothetical protein A8709_10230 [Paenibacillus pectinilyticus]